MSIFKPEERKVFEDPNFIVVSTLGKDGTPRSTTIWVDIEGDDILINGYRSRGWIANLRRNPAIAMCIFDLKDPYFQVNITGEAVEFIDDGAEDHIDKLARKYTGADYKMHRPEDPRQLARIRVKTVHSRLSYAVKK